MKRSILERAAPPVGQEVRAVSGPGGGVGLSIGAVSVGLPLIFYIEDFGDLTTAASARAALSAAFAAIPNGCTLTQRTSDEIMVDKSTPITVSWIGVTVALKLRAAQAGDVFSVKGAAASVFDVSVNMDGNAGSAIRIENCALCKVPRSAVLKGGASSVDVLSIGLLSKNSPSCVLSPTVINFSGADGAKAIRGVMLSDTAELDTNTTQVSLKADRLIGAGTCEADAVFLEGPHNGGAVVCDCEITESSRRFVKTQMKNVTIRNNKGRNSGATGRDMFAFVGAQASGIRIIDNDFSTEGAYGCQVAVDLIDAAVVSRGNKYKSSVSVGSSSAISRSGRIDGAEFIDDEFVNFERLVNQTSATSEVSQSIKIVAKYMRSGAAQNAVTLSGDYSDGFFDVFAPDSITTNYFVSAANVTKKVLKISGSFGYSQPTLNVERFMSEYINKRQMEYSSERSRYSVVAGKAKIIAAAAPTGGVWEVGDEVQKPALSSGQSPGWICVTAGNPGTWAALPALA